MSQKETENASAELQATSEECKRIASLLRYVVSYIWLIPPLAAMAPFRLSGGEVTVLVLGWVAVWAVLSRFHPQRQFLHDALAGTRLVDAPKMGA